MLLGPFLLSTSHTIPAFVPNIDSTVISSISQHASAIDLILLGYNKITNVHERREVPWIRLWKSWQLDNGSNREEKELQKSLQFPLL
jgi:hypothetical protein